MSRAKQSLYWSVIHYQVTFECHSRHASETSVAPCADPESFVRGGPTLTMFLYFFLLDEGRKDLNTTTMY